MTARTPEQTKFRLAINSLMLIPYVAVVSSSPEQVSLWWVLPMLLWGKWAFHQFVNMNRLGPITVPVEPRQFLAISFFGSIFFAGLGMIVIPIFIVYDVYKLMTNRAVKT